MKNFTKTTIVTVLFSLFALTAISQQNFIEFENATSLRLNSEQQQKLSKVQSLSHYKNSEVVTVNALESSLEGNSLSFTLPNYKCKLEFVYKNSVYKSSNEFSWYGEIKGDGESECSFGSIHYVKRNGKTFGQIEVGNDTYEFIDIGDKKHLFYQINENSFKDADCGVDNNTKKAKFESSDFQNQRVTCPGRNMVSILVLYTPNAENTVADIDITAQLSVDQMEQAFQNSHIYQNLIELELVDVLPFAFTESGPAWQDIGIFASDPAAQTLRANNDADLVLLLTDTSYGSTLGIVEDFGPSFNGAYALVQAPSAHSKKVFAHEAGHLLGGRHDNDPTGTIEHGYTFRKWFLGKKRGTIMVSGGGVKDKNRILHFSNPDVAFNNEDTGTHDENDNETHFENTGPIISQFFPNNLPPFDAEISGPDKVCASNPSVYLESELTCGEAPYTYQWEVTDNGVNWQTVGTYQNLYYSPSGPLQPSANLTFRLTTTDSDNNTIVRTHTVTFVDLLPGFECADNTRANNGMVATVYPNPINSNSTLSIDLDKEYSQISAILIDSFGNVVSQNEFTNPKGTLSIPVGRVRLQTGIYYLKIKSENSETVMPIEIFR